MVSEKLSTLTLPETNVAAVVVDIIVVVVVVVNVLVVTLLVVTDHIILSCGL